MDAPIVLLSLESAPWTISAPRLEGVLNRQFQGDGTAEGNTENGWLLQTQLCNQGSEIIGIAGDVQRSRHAAHRHQALESYHLSARK